MVQTLDVREAGLVGGGNAQEAAAVGGLRVAAPLGRGALRAAVLLETSAQIDLPPGVVCKDLCWPLEPAPLLAPDLLALAQDLARQFWG